MFCGDSHGITPEWMNSATLDTTANATTAAASAASRRRGPTGRQQRVDRRRRHKTSRVPAAPTARPSHRLRRAAANAVGLAGPEPTHCTRTRISGLIRRGKANDLRAPRIKTRSTRAVLPHPGAQAERRSRRQARGGRSSGILCPSGKCSGTSGAKRSRTDFNSRAKSARVPH